MLQKLNKKLSRNQKGFSLIELMVAVAILAMAAFGILQAFSNSFQSMAESKDRTIAVNYARKILEDIKNMEYELITNENLSVEVTLDDKFKRYVIVNVLEDNLKEVTAIVHWKDGDVRTSMMINHMQFNPGAADHILIYAESYSLTIGQSTTITAIIKDKDGNTNIDWNEENDIVFSKGDFDPGIITAISETVNGVATANYTADGITSDELPLTITITASVLDLSNSISLTITDKVTKIQLNAELERIYADTINNESLVEASLLDANNTLVTDANNDITLTISGEGNFIDDNGNIISNIITLTPAEGKVSTKVQSINDSPGTITVTASSEGLTSDSLNILSLGEPTSIIVSTFVSDNRNYIYDDGIDSAKITVTIVDQKNNPIPYTGTLSMEGNINEVNVGNFNPTSSLAFNNESVLDTTTFTCTTNGLVSITATGGGLIAGSTPLEVKATLIADNISLTAIPASIPVGGTIDDAATVKATIKSGAYIVENYKNEIVFTLETSTNSTFSEGLTLISQSGEVYGNDGIAEVEVIPAGSAGTATITVTTTNSEGTVISNSIEISFYVIPDRIILEAEPQKVEVGNNKFVISASVVDEYGSRISGYNNEATFTIQEGWPNIVKYQTSNTQNLTTSFSGGSVTIDMSSLKTAGTGYIRATSYTGSNNIYGDLYIPVGINLSLAEPPNIAYDIFENKVGLDINVQGANLRVEQIYFSTTEDNNIKDKLISVSVDNTEIFSSAEGIKSPDTINIIDGSYNLSEGIHTIELVFSNESYIVQGEAITLIFNPNSGYYSISLP